MSIWRLLPVLMGAITWVPIWDPSKLASALHWWDMERSTVTTSSGNVTQVSDIVGATSLTPGAANPPLDVASDGDMGRRSCQHDKANTESLGASISTTSQPLTFWLVGTIDNLTGYSGIVGDSVVANVLFKDAATDAFQIDDGSNTEDGSSVPAVNTPYLFVFTLNGTSSRLHVNNVDEGIAPSAFSAADIADFLIGDTQFSDWGDITWTSAGLTDVAMSSADRTELYDWAVLNCNV